MRTTSFPLKTKKICNGEYGTLFVVEPVRFPLG